VRGRSRHGREPEPLDQLAPAGLGAGEARGELHVGFAGELGKQVEELEDEADVIAPQGAQRALARAGHPPAGHPDLTGFRAVEPAEHVQQRRLARPAAPEDRHDLARLHVEVGAVEDAPRAAALADGLDQPARLDQAAFVSRSSAQELMQ
jgi:hypothetical protein